MAKNWENGFAEGLEKLSGILTGMAEGLDELAERMESGAGVLTKSWFSGKRKIESKNKWVHDGGERARQEEDHSGCDQ